MKISLLQNAYSFLEEALSKAIKAEKEPIHWKFATLNLVQAIELSLKEKLSQEHPVLVFQKIDSPKNTVNLDTALNRLQKIGGIQFSQADISAITKANQLRNEIVHYEFELNEKESKLAFAKLLGFMSHFHTVHIDSPLDSVIDYELWQEALTIFDYAEELFKRAEEIFAEKGIESYLVWTCSQCDWDAFVIQDDINTCYVCGYQSDIIECQDCNELHYIDDCHQLQTGDERFEYFCTECHEERISEEDDRYYFEWMSHFHGK